MTDGTEAMNGLRMALLSAVMMFRGAQLEVIVKSKRRRTVNLILDNKLIAEFVCVFSEDELVSYKVNQYLFS